MNGRGENPLVNNIKDSVYYGCHGEEVTAVEIKNLQRGKNPHNKLVLKTQTKFKKHKITAWNSIFQSHLRKVRH